METEQLFISCGPKQQWRNNIVYAVFIFLEVGIFLFGFQGFFFTYDLFKRFTFLLVDAENLSEGVQSGRLFQSGQLCRVAGCR